MRNYWGVVALHVLLCSVNFSACSTQATDIPTPHTAVVLIDINGTLCRTHKLAAVTTWLRNAPTILSGFWRSKEEYSSYLDAFKDASAIAASCQTIMEPVAHFARALKEQGFAVYIFTGLLPEMVRALQERYPDCFRLFDGIIFQSAACGWTDKRSDTFFAYAEEQLAVRGHHVTGPLQNKLIYFFDDEEPNAQRARNRGWKAVATQTPEALLAAAHDFGFTI